MPWSIELFKYRLNFKPRKVIKAQVLVDFVTELASKEPDVVNGGKTSNWVLYFDGLANRSRRGDSFILEGQKGLLWNTHCVLTSKRLIIK